MMLQDSMTCTPIQEYRTGAGSRGAGTPTQERIRKRTAASAEPKAHGWGLGRGWGPWLGAGGRLANMHKKGGDSIEPPP